MSRPAYIYLLLDPRDGRPRYVGRSYRPDVRLREHAKPNTPRRLTPKERWVAELNAAGLAPAMRLLAKVGGEIAVEQERFWIRYYALRGCELVNSTPQGLAVEFFNRTSEARAA